MNRIIVAIALLIISATICTMEIHSVSINSEECIEKLNETVNHMYLGNYNEAIKAAETASHAWKNNTKILDIFLYHDYVDEITESMSTLVINTKEKNNKVCSEIVEKIKVQLASIKNSELPYLHNIL